MRHHFTELFYADDGGRQRIEVLDATPLALPHDAVPTAAAGAPA